MYYATDVLRTCAIPLHQNVDPSLINDYVEECKRMDGVIKYKVFLFFRSKEWTE
jgi:hypothetical protein